jgi:triosephosphate isomerase
MQACGAFTGSHTIEQVVGMRRRAQNGNFRRLDTSISFADFGLKWTLVGHSERRSIWHETDAESATKTKVLCMPYLEHVML